MKISMIRNATLLGALNLVAASSAFADCYNGWATPSTITYNFKSLSANTDSNSSATLIADPFAVTFKRTDANFAATEINDIELSYGRYVSIGLCYGDSVDVTLDGVKFDGKGDYNCSAGSSPLAAGSTLYSTNATNGAGAITTSGTAVATKFTGETGCAITYFPTPVCVTDSNQAECQAGDLVYTSTGAADNTKGNGEGTSTVNASFKISLLVDLYDGVVIDGGVGKILGVPKVLALAGDPGAAIHLTVPQSASGSTVPFNASLLFGADKKLLSAQVSQGNGAIDGSPLTHTCQGGNNVAITGASSNFPYDRLGYVSTTANSGKGQVLFPVASECGSVAVCNSKGANQIDNIFQAVGNSASLTCVADSSSSFQTTNFGKNYTGGAGPTAAGTDSAKIVRIVDPGNIFGVCATSPCVDTTIATGAGGYL